MEHVKQVLEVLRDLGIILGIPTLIALLLKTANARVVILKDQIAYLTETHHAQVELLRITIEAQEKQYERELEQLRQEKTQAVTASDSRKESAIEKDIEAVKRSLLMLDRLRWSIRGGLESEAVRKFEWFCRDLADPDTPTAD